MNFMVGDYVRCGTRYGRIIEEVRAGVFRVQARGEVCVMPGIDLLPWDGKL